jgi:SAM-dependent methyltransferase
MTLIQHSKAEVGDFWDAASCGEALFLDGTEIADYAAQSEARYRLEPFIESFADFAGAKGKKVLEIGVGLGADHQRFAEAGAIVSGIDLTNRAIEHTRRRFELLGLASDLRQGDAENLPFADNTFDVIYSWGVIHHSPDTPRAARELMRVLKPGGRYAVMIYNRWSVIGLVLWLRYGLIGLKGLRAIYAQYVESPGTKAYTRREARQMFPGARVSTVLCSGDLMEGGSGQRHEGRMLDLARRVWPRRLIRQFPGLGLFMLIEGRKP